jgi:hypothetical protein
MKYFNSLPKVVYTNENNVKTIYTNLMARASVIPSVLNNALVYYDYDIQDEDTPEIVSHKYYGDVNRFWIVMYCNQLLDPLWDWPLSSRKFEKYVLTKYGGTLSNTHHYEKVTTKINRTSNITTVETDIISEDDYNDTVYNSTSNYTVGSDTISVNVATKIVTNYEYEIKENDSKRSIKILNREYANRLEREFMDLMGSNG